MRNALLFLLFIFVVDLYCYYGLHAQLQHLKSKIRRIIKLTYLMTIGIVLLFMSIVVYNSTFAGQRGMTPNVYNFMGVLILFYVPKLFIVTILAVNDMYRVLKWLILKIISKQTRQNKPLRGRRSFLTKSAFVLSAMPFIGILDGIFRGRFNFKVHRHNHIHKDVPDAFNGFKIVQISDIHAQSFWDTNALERVYHTIQSLNPDIIVFTGDLVNNLASEVDPIIEQFIGLQAPFGMYAVLGNHDYGDYYRWDNIQDKIDNHKRVQDNYAKLGFKLLNNDAVKIKKGEQFIEVAGVENWGLPPFPQAGDLDKALEKCSHGSFKILLSHDPSHWKEKVLPHKERIHLTLSGHTHGMQFGIEIPGIRWSPSKWKYHEWAGLYNQDDEYIYVNRGLGCVGFPGRVGIWPEITLITLNKNNA